MHVPSGRFQRPAGMAVVALLRAWADGRRLEDGGARSGRTSGLAVWAPAPSRRVPSCDGYSQWIRTTPGDPHDASLVALPAGCRRAAVAQSARGRASIRSRRERSLACSKAHPAGRPPIAHNRHLSRPGTIRTLRHAGWARSPWCTARDMRRWWMPSSPPASEQHNKRRAGRPLHPTGRTNLRRYPVGNHTKGPSHMPQALRSSCVLYRDRATSDRPHSLGLQQAPSQPPPSTAAKLSWHHSSPRLRACQPSRVEGLESELEATPTCQQQRSPGGPSTTGRSASLGRNGMP